jgi:hypothetical protein
MLMPRKTLLPPLLVLVLGACSQGERHVDPPVLTPPTELRAGEVDEAAVTRGPSGEMTFDAHLAGRPVTQYFQLDFTVRVQDQAGAPAEGVAVEVDAARATADRLGFQQLSDADGRVTFGITLNTRGTQTLLVDTHSHGSMTVRVNARAPDARFDGQYFCALSYPVSGTTGAPLELRPQMVIVGGGFDASAAEFEEFSFDQDTGAFAAVLLRAGDQSDRMQGTFSVDMQDVAVAAGTLEEESAGIATGAVGTWRCTRGERPD